MTTAICKYDDPFQPRTVRFNAKKWWATLVLALVFLEPAFCQSQLLDEIRNSINTYKNSLQEKIFVHTDKSFYVAGEIIWFRVYNTEAITHKLLNISKVAYIEVLDADQKQVLQAKIALNDGMGSGSIYLPFSINSGNFRLRAYTNWMKNFSADDFFEKDLTIVNPTRKLGAMPASDSLTGYDIQFFPEGGNLVGGIESRVAFRAIDRLGRGIDFSGTIMGDHQDTLLAIRPLRNGIGSFLFTPTAGHTYSALIRTADSQFVKIELPKIYKEGYVMRAYDTTENRLCVRVQVSGNLINLFDYILVHDRHRVRAAQTQQLLNGQAVFVVSKDSLDEGVNCITLFDHAKNPVCERLYFKKPKRQMSIGIQADQAIYETRKKIGIDFASRDPAAKPLSASLSVSVYRLDSLDEPASPHLFEYLWLGSELSGKVESPGYYIDSSGPEAEVATDNLMLSQGWRRFPWHEELPDRAPALEFAPEWQGHIITGRVVDKNTGEPVADVLTFLSVPAKNFQLVTAVSDAQGWVKYDVQHFFTADEIALQTVSAQDSNVRIDISSPFSEKTSLRKTPVFLPKSLELQTLVDQGIHSQVQNIFSGENLQKFDLPVSSDTMAFYGTPDQKYFLDDYTRFNTMEEVMREFIADITVRKHDGHYHYKVLDYPYKSFFADDALVLFDGVPVTDLNKVMAFDPLKIKKIEVMNRRYFLGAFSADGIISYSTYKGDLAGFQLDPSVLILKYEGLQLQREFYAPKYGTADEQNSRIPDFRSVLYWSPDLKTDSTGHAQLSFYASDLKGKYALVAEGTTADGKPGSGTLTFEVKNQ